MSIISDLKDALLKFTGVERAPFLGEVFADTKFQTQWNARFGSAPANVAAVEAALHGANGNEVAELIGNSLHRNPTGTIPTSFASLTGSTTKTTEAAALSGAWKKATDQHKTWNQLEEIHGWDKNAKYSEYEKAAKPHLESKSLKAAEKAKKLANEAGQFKGQNFSGKTVKTDTGLFSRVRSVLGKSVTSNKAMSQFNELDRLNKSLEDAKKRNRPTKYIEERIEKLKSGFGSEVEGLARQANLAEELHGDAIAAIGNAQQEALNKLDKKYDKLFAKAKPGTAAYDQLQHVYDHERIAVNNHFNHLSHEHKTTLEKIEKLKANIAENTHINPADLRNTQQLTKAAEAGSTTAAAALKTEKGIIGEAKWAQKGMIGKIVSSGEAVFKSGVIGKTRVAAGVILTPTLGVMAASDIAEGMGLKSPGADDQGNPKPTDGKLISGIAKAGGAVLTGMLATMGGGKIARGLR